MVENMVCLSKWLNGGIVENQKTDWMVEYVENGVKLTKCGNWLNGGNKLTEWWNMVENWLNGGSMVEILTEWWKVI